MFEDLTGNLSAMEGAFMGVVCVFLYHISAVLKVISDDIKRLNASGAE